MSANTVAKEPGRVVRVAHPGTVTYQDLAEGNFVLVKRLAKATKAELDMTALPDAHDDVFKRRVVVMKSPLAPNEINPPSADMVNLEDMGSTDLPWMGHITIAPFGSRQLRGRNAFYAAVELIREIDGFLWLIKNDVKSNVIRDSRPVVIDVIAPTRRDACYKLRSWTCDSQDEHLEHFGDAPLLPASLDVKLKEMGFLYDEEANVYHHAEYTDVSSRIQVILYGKIITPL